MLGIEKRQAKPSLKSHVHVHDDIKMLFMSELAFASRSLENGGIKLCRLSCIRYVHVRYLSGKQSTM